LGLLLIWKQDGHSSQKKEINMKLGKNMKSSLAGLFAIGLLAGAVSSQAQSYNITDLGALPGDNNATVGGLNSLGQAAGTSSSSSSAIATLFSNGHTISLGALGASDMSFAEAINGSGQVVGYDWLSSGVSHAFLYSNGRMTDIHSASLFPSGSTATAINNSGAVVGYGWISTADEHAFLYTGGRTVDLGTLGGNDATALAISDSGQVVGVSATASGAGHAFIYANGRMTDLGTPASANSSSAAAINRNGQIAGAASFGTATHAVMYSNGVWTDLGMMPGATVGNLATSINNSGQVVGVSIFPILYNKHPLHPTTHVGFIYRNGSLVDLNTLVPANSGFLITSAVSINDAGEILCNAKTTTGVVYRAVLLTPK
jgi:probable HAF family extracellular repeat protein